MSLSLSLSFSASLLLSWLYAVYHFYPYNTCCYRTNVYVNIYIHRFNSSFVKKIFAWNINGLFKFQTGFASYTHRHTDTRSHARKYHRQTHKYLCMNLLRVCGCLVRQCFFIRVYVRRWRIEFQLKKKGQMIEWIYRNRTGNRTYKSHEYIDIQIIYFNKKKIKKYCQLKSNHPKPPLTDYNVGVEAKKWLAK